MQISKRGKLMVLVVLALMLTVLSSQAVIAGGDVHIWCADEGGTWEWAGYGPFGDNGDCTFAANTTMAVNECGPDMIAVTHHTSGNSTRDSVSCIDPLSVASSNPSYGQTGASTASGKRLLNLNTRLGVTVEFEDDACPQQCTISANLPAGAKGALPGNAITTLYVRVVAEGGVAGDGGYTACFDTTGLTDPEIYRFEGGAWTRVAARNENPLCVTGFGDGAYYLSGN